MLLIQKGVIKHSHAFFHTQPACLCFSVYWSSSELEWNICWIRLDLLLCPTWHVEGETAPAFYYLNFMQCNLMLYVDHVFSLQNLLQTPWSCVVKSHILTSFILEKGRDLTGSFRNICKLSHSHHQHCQIKSHSEFVTHTTNTSSKNTSSTNPLGEFSAILCILSFLLIQILWVGSSCFQQTEPKDEIQQRNSAIPPTLTAVTHSSSSPQCSGDAHPSVCSVPPGAGLGKLRLLEQTPWRFPACWGSLSDLQTGLQPPTYCKKQTCIKCFTGQLQRGLGSYSCEILLGSSKSNNQNGD